jgi:4-phospho-D-threonate 3-dehydrogenase / 4-phospho-D-erythronate 3-dehydrogenase
MGDPAGIGPEVIIKAFAKQNENSPQQLLVIGDTKILKNCAESLKLDHAEIVAIKKPSDFIEGKINVIETTPAKDIELAVVSAQGGALAFSYIDLSIKLAIDKQIDGVVTCPINKEALHAAGFKYPGHTEIYAEKCGVENFSMMFSLEDVSIVHVTTHCSLREALDLVSVERVTRNIDLLHNALLSLGFEKPRIAVGGINPHAGENGLFGDEEIHHITPAIEAAQNRGLDVTGPFPPDTVFMSAFKGQYDGVVAMLHDHGFVAVKSRDFEKGVNITIGLPMIRTSVGHGTAFDIVGKGIASEGSLLSAIDSATKMAHFKQYQN